MHTYIKRGFHISVACILLAACSKFVTVDPPATSFVDETVFLDSASANAGVLGLYSRAMQGNLTSLNGGMVLYGSLLSDELVATTTQSAMLEFYEYGVQPTNSQMIGLWREWYEQIYHANAILEGLDRSDRLSPTLKDRLRGEAMFMRAFCYFQLIQWFGPVPLVLTTDYRENKLMGRTELELVYEKMLEDAKEASVLLPADFSKYKNQRNRPTIFAAYALLAQLHLFGKDWENAEAYATKIIETTSLFGLAKSPEAAFNVGDLESIWQLQPVVTGMNTGISLAFVQTTGIPQYGYISPDLWSQFSEGDRRKEFWTLSYTFDGKDYHLPYKYKFPFQTDGIEYLTVFRLAEMYLLRAEARAEMNKLPEGQADLQVIRSRSGLTTDDFSDKSDLVAAIIRERRIELFAENGMRWLDLKRKGLADMILSALKPDTWIPTAVLLPLPASELTNNSNLYQNPGY